MRRATSLLLALGFSLLAAPRDVSAQTVALTARMQRFYFHGALGVGYGRFASSTGAGQITLHGAGAMGNFAIGVNLVRGLSVHVDACAMALVTPTVSVNNVDQPTVSRADSTSTTSIIGGGLTWTQHDGLVWVSLAGGVSVLGVEIPSAMSSSTGVSAPAYGLTQFGWGVNLLAGHDWPIVYNWRVGLALQAIFTQMPDQPFMGSTPTWENFGGGLSLTVSDR
jgi:hypothetical protein